MPPPPAEKAAPFAVVPIMASDGEYVIPADVVAVKGTEFFDRLVEKYHTPAKEQRRAIQ